ncbi:UNKNOWN [Stylonychia lemnae]|uniref:Tetratricopeptide repeat protein n=1 Tax=Stylonychia lemnae TaxID=5949 RepID=A0A078AST6_STYLE|nr:UNKNOWN [Stylonychia lemnae]|eukprot:CDW84277.1 UNKNOWN [Stylonychia lemnae]
MGLNEFKEAIQLMYQYNYAESELYIKETLKVLKQQGYDKSQSYLYVLKRLAYVTFKQHKYEESEKYFKICEKLCPLITKNPANLFANQKNLLIYYTYTDLAKAEQLGQRMLQDLEETLPAYNKELCHLTGVSKNLYRNCLKQSPKPLLEGINISFYMILAHTLNNLACASWQHYTTEMKVKTIPEITKEKEIAIQDNKHTLTYFKDAIEKLETLHYDKLGLKRTLDEYQLMENLIDKDHAVPKDLSSDNQELYFSLLKSKDVGKVISNISEYLLDQEGSKGEQKNPGFWFKFGLNYYEKIDPEHIDRHLILLGLFYASSGDTKTAEMLYGQALEKMQGDISFTKVMGMNLYGRLLIKNKKREQEATKYLSLSERIGTRLPYWYDRIEYLYIPEFDLD